jgi:two-component system heavy metal sensor histidine kinase CusS
LSWWLALQSLGGLALVLAGVYAWTAWTLEQRQADFLVQKQRVVEHLLGEAEREGSLSTLRHTLDDFLIGNSGLGLRLTTPDGRLLYWRDAMAAARWTRSAQFGLASVQVPGGIQGRVVLDTTADVLLLRRLGTTMLVSALLGAALVSLSGTWLVRRGLRPVRALSRQIHCLNPNNLRVRLDGNGQPLEMQPVVEQFNELLERLEWAYAQLEAFNADVAHELRTPLAILIGHSEVALSRPRSVHELQEVIGANLEDLQRLSALVNDMLFLSKADRGTRARRTDVSSIAAIVNEVVEFHEATLQEAGLQVRMQGDASGAFDVALLRRALSNLLTNATRYAHPASTIEIGIAMPSKAVVRLTVSNAGLTIEPRHLPRLFDRFYRADAARERSERNYGLGLAIVAAIARMHDGEVFAASDSGRTSVGMQLSAGAD